MIDAESLTKTLEDLAMDLVEAQCGDLYNEKILHLYNKVTGVIKKEMDLPGEKIGYGTPFNDLIADPTDISRILTELEEFYNIEMPYNIVTPNIRNTYDIVVCILGNEKANVDSVKVGDKEAKQLVESNFDHVSSIHKQVQELIKEYGGMNFNINTPILAIEGLKKIVFENSLNKKLTQDVSVTSELMKKTPYDIVKYLAKKPAQ